MQTCANCEKLSERLRKAFCDVCYKKFRIHGDPNYQKPIVEVVLTQQQINLIIGSMLGDGHIRKRGRSRNASFHIRRAQKDYDYLIWQSKILSNLLTKKGIFTNNVYDCRTHKTYYSCMCDTRSLNILNPYHHDWYENNVKIIPNDLKLNAEIIAIWFCDDGTIRTSSSENRFVMSFATHSFSKDEVFFLRDLLNDRYHENFSVNKRESKSHKLQYIIKGADAASRALISDIDQFFPQGMQRKRIWDNPKTCFYENVPAKYQSHQASQLEKQTQILQFLQNHDEFYLTDLAKHLNWTFTRSNGIIELDTQNTKRFLKKYIEEGSIQEMPRENNLYKRGIKYLRIRSIEN